MADWASLINSPLPQSEPTICEVNGQILTSSDPRGQAKILEISQNLPQVDLAIQDPKIGHKLQVDTTFLSAKSAFLPAEKSTSVGLRPNVGFFEDFIAANEETYWFKFLSSLFNFGFSFRAKLNPEEIIQVR